jgi:predicted nucleic acid-binding protein
VSYRDVSNLLDAVAGILEPVEVRYLWRPQLADTDDDMVLECAVNGAASHLVTFNIQDFRIAALRFGLKALRPGDLLKEIRS